jgi:hypothetical protein
MSSMNGLFDSSSSDPFHPANPLFFSPTDALPTLRTLASSGEKLGRCIAEIATAHLSEMDPLASAYILCYYRGG